MNNIEWSYAVFRVSWRVGGIITVCYKVVSGFNVRRSGAENCSPFHAPVSWAAVLTSQISWASYWFVRTY